MNLLGEAVIIRFHMSSKRLRTADIAHSNGAFDWRANILPALRESTAPYMFLKII